MTERITDWLESFWAKKEKPPAVKAGQIWTMFRKSQDIEDSDPGTLIVILRNTEKGVCTLIMHDDPEFLRGIDITLKTTDSSLGAEIIVMPDSEFTLGLDAFKDASYIGNLTKDGIESLVEGRKSYQNIVDAQTRLQFLETMGEISENEINQAVQNGISKLFPLKVKIKQFRNFERELTKNVAPYAISRFSKHHQAAAHDLNQYQIILEEMSQVIVHHENNPELVRSLLSILKKICLYVFAIGTNPRDYAPVAEVLNSLLDKLENDLELMSLQYLIAGLGNLPEKQMTLPKASWPYLVEFSKMDQGLAGSRKRAH